MIYPHTKYRVAMPNGSLITVSWNLKLRKRFARPQCYFLFNKNADFTNVADISLRMLKVKLKCTLVQALRLCTGRSAHRGSRSIALPFHDHGTRRGWGVSVTPRTLFTPGKDPVPILQEALRMLLYVISGPHRCKCRSILAYSSTTMLTRPIQCLSVLK